MTLAFDLDLDLNLGVDVDLDLDLDHLSVSFSARKSAAPTHPVGRLADYWPASLANRFGTTHCYTLDGTAVNGAFFC